MLKLSEAIRLGSLLHPQGFDRFLTKHNDGSATTCALGAAFEAGYDPILINQPTPKAECPVCGVPSSVYSLTAHINDTHRWTRERIADWVQSVEDAQPKETPALVEVA